MSIMHETLSGMSLFKDEILDSFILHIPHASTFIPNYEGFVLGKVEENINLLTDWATDKIFEVDGIATILTPYSRIFCDVERFDDESEPMSLIGRGFYYTNGYDGSELRELNVISKDSVYRDFYLKHHEFFYDMVTATLEKHGVCHIIDCHSFNDNPKVPFNNDPKSPDICIGTDAFHTPNYLLNYTFNYFTNLGYSTEVNDPYAGCIIPKPYYLQNNSVKGIMIEINKRLYMNDNHVDHNKVKKLNEIIKRYFEDLV